MGSRSLNGSIWSQPPGRFGVGVGVGEAAEPVGVGAAAVWVAPACDRSDPPELHAAVSAAIPTTTRTQPDRATDERRIARPG